MSTLYSAITRELEEVSKVLERQWREVDPLLSSVEECIIATGAGDSYAVAVGIEAIDPRVIAFDPLDLLLNSARLLRILENKCILLALSVGGRTRSVIALARNYRQRGGKVVAVTADSKSLLARESDFIASIVYGGLAAGIGALRHLSMIVAVARVLGLRKPVLEKNNYHIHAISLKQEPIYVGLCESFSSAVFTVLKLYEIYGWKARYEKLEQFLHAPIFTTNHIVFFQSSICNSIPRKFLDLVEKTGYKVESIPSFGSDGVSNLLGQSIAVLREIATKTRKDGVDKPFYKEHPKLNILTDIIYE